jgi:zinc/manganese transport system permease protein
MDSASLTIILPALAAGLLVSATHVPLGMQVLARGIVFIDIAIAQIAGAGVVTADFLGFEAHGLPVQAWALGAALLGALALTWTEKRWPEAQEAIIGVTFVLAATAEILLLARNPQGGEHLKDLLIGQILWVSNAQLLTVAALTAAVLAIWFGLRGKLGRLSFYLLFGLSVTASVQLVGVYLVFATLIIPALATHRTTRRRLAKAFTVAALGYIVGLVLSAAYDLPSGAVIVWAMGVTGMGMFAFEARARSTAPSADLAVDSRRYHDRR